MILPADAITLTLRGWKNRGASPACCLAFSQGHSGEATSHPQLLCADRTLPHYL